MQGALSALHCRAQYGNSMLVAAEAMITKGERILRVSHGPRMTTMAREVAKQIALTKQLSQMEPLRKRLSQMPDLCNKECAAPTADAVDDPVNNTMNDGAVGATSDEVGDEASDAVKDATSARAGAAHDHTHARVQVGTTAMGRGLFLSTAVAAGTTVLWEAAFAFAADSEQPVCTSCGSLGALLCAGDRWTRFCARCASSGEVVRHDASPLGGCLRQLEVEPSVEPGEAGSATTSLRLALAVAVRCLIEPKVLSRVEQLAMCEPLDAQLAAEHTEAIERLVAPLRSNARPSTHGLMPDGPLDVHVGKLASRALRVVDANSFAVRDAAGRKLGRALFLTASAINHCCSGGNAIFAARAAPREVVQDTVHNAVHDAVDHAVNENVTISVRTVCALNSGDEVRVCYRASCLFLPTSLRRSALRAACGFDCACALCKCPTYESATVAVRNAAEGATDEATRDAAFGALYCAICRIRMERCEGGSLEMGRMSVQLAMYEPHDIPPACRVCFRALDSQAMNGTIAEAERLPRSSLPPSPSPSPIPSPAQVRWRRPRGEWQSCAASWGAVTCVRRRGCY